MPSTMVTVDGFPVPVDVAGPDKGSVVVVLGAAGSEVSASVTASRDLAGWRVVTVRASATAAREEVP